MQYRLRGNNDTLNIIQTVLINRGIAPHLCDKYINANKVSRDTYKNLDNINKAVDMFVKHFGNKHPIAILADSDTDGQCSCTLMYKYIKELDEDYDVRLYVHERNKSHGLVDKDFVIDEDVKLLIVPDAGSNEIAEHKELYDQGIDCICLDHHHVAVDISDSPAIVVNNQIGEKYENQNCCGAHVTLEFCRALDEYYWEEISDNYLDLVAVANVADVMELAELETKAVITEGCQQINNKMLKEIIKAQEFSMKGKINPHTVGFYISPLINAFIRMATYEERKLLLKAFCEIEDETFEYIKRGEAFSTEENIYEHVVRLAKSYKGKQDRIRDKAVKQLLAKVGQYENDKVIIMDASKEIEGPLAGLAAIRISEQLHKPVLLVREHAGALAGSGRAFDGCPIDDFRKLVDDNPYTTFANGHSSAFGLALPADNIDKATQWFNEQLASISMDKIYHVDFIFDSPYELDVDFVQTIDSYENLWGHGLEEPLVVVKDITLRRDDIHIQGKDYDSITFSFADIKYVQFKMSEDNELLQWASSWDGEPDDEITITIVGTVSVSEYKGIHTAQFTIKENMINGMV